VIAELTLTDMACSLALVPLASFAGWRGGSTAGPFHYRKSDTLVGIAGFCLALCKIPLEFRLC
jgi:hypothetical protein